MNTDKIQAEYEKTYSIHKKMVKNIFERNSDPQIRKNTAVYNNIMSSVDDITVNKKQ